MHNITERETIMEWWSAQSITEKIKYSGSNAPSELSIAEILDVYNTLEWVSNCCGAEYDEDDQRCMDCKEHCSPTITE